MDEAPGHGILLAAIERTADHTALSPFLSSIPLILLFLEPATIETWC